MPTTRLSEDDLARFREQGAIRLPAVFDRSSLSLLERGIDRNVAQPSKHHLHHTGERGRGAYRGDYWSWKWIPEYLQFVRDSGLGAIAGEVLGAAQVHFLEDNYFIKEAGCPIATPWHQDFPYFEVDGDFVSAWIPLTRHEADETLMFIAGSHAWDRIFMPVSFDGRSDDELQPTLPPGYERAPDFDADPDTYQVLAWAVDPGDCLLFHARTVHGSRANFSASAGKRFSCRFFGASARYAQESHPWSGFDEIAIPRGQRLADDPENFPLV